MSETQFMPSGLMVVAREATGRIISYITSHRYLVSAMHTAHGVRHPQA